MFPFDNGTSPALICYPDDQLGGFPRLVVVVVGLLSQVRLFVTPWSAARPASLSSVISCRLLKLMSIESVMPSNHLILCCLLLLLSSIFPRIRVFSSESALGWQDTKGAENLVYFVLEPRKPPPKSLFT